MLDSFFWCFLRSGVDRPVLLVTCRPVSHAACLCALIVQSLCARISKYKKAPPLLLAFGCSYLEGDDRAVSVQLYIL